MTLLVHATDAEVLGLDPNTIQLLADGSSDGAISAVRTRMAKGTEGPPAHYHKGAPEIFFIIEGGLHVLAGEDVVTMREGDYLLVPPQTTHAFCTPDDAGVDMLFLMPGIERFEYFPVTESVEVRLTWRKSLAPRPRTTSTTTSRTARPGVSSAAATLGAAIPERTERPLRRPTPGLSPLRSSWRSKRADRRARRGSRFSCSRLRSG
jgi:quercetin dioxygenase-like cupin family protein